MTASVELEAALSYAAHGVPVHPLWGKVPIRAGFGSTTDEAQIRRHWSGSTDLNVGMPTGSRSGFVVIDIDDEGEWSSVLESVGCDEPATLTVRTGTGGRHLFFALPENQTFTNHSPWRRIDVRGEGGQVVLPPSVHPETGKRYKFQLPKGERYFDVAIAELPRWIAEHLRAPRAEDTHVPYDGPANEVWGQAALDAELARVASAEPGTRNNTLFEAACNVSEVANGGHVEWSTARAQLLAAATSAGLGPEAGSTVQSARHKTAGRARGPETDEWNVEIIGEASFEDEAVENDEVSSWMPADPAEVLASDGQEISPAILTMTNGRHIIYPGVVHSFHGESESLKTWLCLAAVVQELVAGRAAAYIDFEMTAQQVFARLLQLGASEDHLTHFLYSGPSEPLTPAVRDDLLEEYVRRDVRLVVIDGMTEALALHGLDLIDNKATATFHNMITKPLKLIGAAVIVIDHVLKDRERRVRGPIGAQHKLAGVDVGIAVERVSPFAPGGHRGRSMLVIDKDRHGQLRGMAKDAKHLGDLVLTSQPDSDRIEFQVVPAMAGAGDDSNEVAVDFSFAYEMDRLSEILDSLGIPPEAGRDRVGRALREQGEAISSERVRQLLRFRREAEWLDDESSS